MCKRGGKSAPKTWREDMEPRFSAGCETCYSKKAQACACTQASSMLQVASREVTVREERTGNPGVYQQKAQKWLDESSSPLRGGGSNE